MSTSLYGSAVRLALAGMIAPASLFATPPAGQRLLFEWQGRVDKEIRVEIRGNRTVIDRIGNKETSNGRVRDVGMLPQSDANITVETLEGRGRVDVLQQPTRQNGYTAVVRVRDPQSGASNYRIRAYTTASQNDQGRDRNDHRNDGRWDNRDRDRSGGWDRGSYGNDRDPNRW